MELCAAAHARTGLPNPAQRMFVLPTTMTGLWNSPGTRYGRRPDAAAQWFRTPRSARSPRSSGAVRCAVGGYGSGMIPFPVDDVTPAGALLPTRPLGGLFPDALAFGGDPALPMLDPDGVHPL